MAASNPLRNQIRKDQACLVDFMIISFILKQQGFKKVKLDGFTEN